MKIDYYAYHSGMRQWNAGMKMLLSIGTLILMIAFNKIWISLFVVFTMGLLTLGVGKIPWKVYRYYMTVPISFMLLSGAAIALDFAFHPVGEWNLSLYFFYICFTRQGIWLAVNVFLKAMGGMSALYMLAFSTPIHEVILVLQKFHLPPLVAELMNLIYRYIFILFDVAHQMQTAARARLGYRTFRQSMRSFAGIAGNLFFISMKKANAYYDAMIARGYHGKLEFLMEEHPIKSWQIAGCLMYFVLLAVLAVAV